MNQLTLRGMDSQLETRLQALAREKNISLNKAALLLMRQGAGLDLEYPANTVGNSLDALIGSWTAEDEQAFEETQSIFETIDEDLWS